MEGIYGLKVPGEIKINSTALWTWKMLADRMVIVV